MEENNSLKVSVEKMSAILEQEKAQFQKLAGVLKMVRMENQALTEKSVSLSGLTKMQENEINSLKQDKLKVEEQHERAKVTISQIQRERQSLRGKISQLNNEIVRLQVQMELLEAKNYIEELNSEIERLKAKIKETEEQSTQYRSLADCCDQQLKEVTEQTENSIKSFQKELNALKEEGEAKSAQILSLKSSLDMRIVQIECFEKVKETIREERQKEVENLENDLKAASVTMKLMGQKTTDLQNEIKAVKASADEKDDNYRNEVIAHARSVDAMKLLREEFKEVSKRLAAAEKTAADAVSKEKLIEAKCSVDVQALETRLSELNSSNIELRKINEILQDQVAKLSEAAEAERNLSVSSTLDEERTNQQLLERERTTKRASLGAPEGETLLRKVVTMTCLQDSNRRLRDELTILQSQFDEVKNKLDTATKELEPLKEKNRKLNEQFDSISVEATVLRTEIARVKTQSAVFSRGVTERAKFQAEKESLEKSLKAKEAEVARIKNSLDNALKQVESAQRNFDQSKITVDQLNARNEQMKNKIEELNLKLDESDKSKTTMQEELNSIRDNLGITSQELITLKADLEKKTQELAKANNISSLLKAIGRKYKNMYEEIRKQLDELKKEEPSATALPVKEETVDETIPKKAPQQQSTSKGLALQPRLTPSGPPAASIRPMAMQTRTVGQATPIVTCTATEASTISSVPAILSVNIQAERPVTTVVALVPPTPSTEAQPTEGPSEGASTSQAKSIEQEAPVSESGTSVQKPKRQREPDSTPDESLKKRTREEELSQEPVTETPESIQREADLRRSLLAARRTTGLAVTVKEGLRSAVVQPSSSAIEEIEISSGSENEPTWEEGNDEVSYDEGEVTEVSEDIEEDEEASEEEQSNDDSGLSSENEATVGEEMMAINEQRGELEHPESSLAEQPSRSEIGDENGEVPLSKASSPKKQRSGDSSNEMGTSTQVAARPFMFGVSPAMEGQTSGTRDFEATDAGQLEEGEGLEVLFEEVAEVSMSGQEASAGDGTEMVDSPASGNDGTAMAQSSSLQAGSVRGSQGYTRGGSTLRRRFHRQQISASADFIAPDFTSPQQISADFTSPQRQQISSQHQFSASGGRARRSRGSFKRTKHYCGC